MGSLHYRNLQEEFPKKVKGTEIPRKLNEFSMKSSKSAGLAIV